MEANFCHELHSIHSNSGNGKSFVSYNSLMYSARSMWRSQSKYCNLRIHFFFLATQRPINLPLMEGPCIPLLHCWMADLMAFLRYLIEISVSRVVRQVQWVRAAACLHTALDSSMNGNGPWTEMVHGGIQ